jgi:zinc protease
VAFGPNSELYQRLVLRERKAQSLNNGFSLQRDPALLSASATVIDAADLPYVEGAILETARRLQNEPVDPKLLADTKSNMKYGFLMGLETAQNTAFSVIPVVVNTGGIEAVDDYYRTLDAVTADDVREAARRFLVDRSLTVVTMVQREGR